MIMMRTARKDNIVDLPAAELQPHKLIAMLKLKISPI